MNNARRKQINEAIDALDAILTVIESILDDEQEAFNNTPESLQSSERGERAQEAINSLEYARDNITQSIDDLNTASE